MKYALPAAYFTAVVDHTRVEILAIGDKPDRKAIEVALPLGATDHTLDGLLVTYLILVGVGIVLAGVVGLVIGRAAVAPILRFAARTEQATSSLTRPRRLELGSTSELQRLAISFNRTLDALEESIQAQRHLIADASHELRTPMTALRSNIQIFLDAGQLPVEERLELPPTVVEGTPELIDRAVDNLIDNARKWSSEDGLIEVSLDGSTVIVRDHGPGIAEADLPHVFDRFYRSDRARRMPGSGLGLAIVKQAAEAHGGRASAANAPGGGALMRVSFTQA